VSCVYLSCLSQSFDRVSRILFFYLLVTWALHTSPPPSPSSTLPPSPLHYLPACCSRSSFGARNHLHPTPFCIRTCTEIATAIGKLFLLTPKEKKSEGKQSKGKQKTAKSDYVRECVCSLFGTRFSNLYTVGTPLLLIFRLCPGTHSIFGSGSVDFGMQLSLRLQGVAEDEEEDEERIS
jgi:hypothetical protein